jgi:Zn-dependent protease
MRDPLTWSFPIGRFFGIAVRVHLLFLFFTISMVARGMKEEGGAAAALLVQLLLFLSVLLHEFGHCFAARQVDGDATDILMWPLGGLASIDVPNTPRANFITTIGGPAVNFFLCCAAGGALVAYQYVPPMNPFWEGLYKPSLSSWATGVESELTRTVPALMAQVFYINWMLMWFNVLLVGFPLDGGRMLQCVLWPYLGFRQATLVVIFSGWIIALLLTLFVVIQFGKDNGSEMLMLFFLALFIYVTCKQQFILLETGGLSEDKVFGYDFSQGYTSLERETVQTRRPRQSFWKRWLERRAARRRQRDQEQRQEVERRVDELLDKVQRSGIQSLTDEERRFLHRASTRYKNRHQP